MKINFRTYVSIFSLALVITGCAGTAQHMQPVPIERAISAPEKDKSLIIFMRPSIFGFAIKSSVFEIQDNDLKFIGFVAAKKKVAYQVPPGDHTFMVVGENADFMAAKLEAGKTYYALVTPRMGFGMARFSLNPIQAKDLTTAEFEESLNACDLVEKNEESEMWSTENISYLKSLRKKYFNKWIQKDESKRPILLPHDGK